MLKKMHFQSFTKRLQKSLLILGIAGAATLTAIPVLAKYYGPYSLFQPTASGGHPYRNSKISIADTLAKDTKYANLVHELKKAGLFDTLKQENAKFTLFAPTNKAFNALPAAQFKEYSKPENRRKTLAYHIVPGEITKKDVDSGSKITLEGSAVKITVSPDGNVMINKAKGMHPSIETSNGVIVEISNVLKTPN
ncbi:MAG: fasciclin domain-containing protein [Calothrix sp. MO_167.B42]|nr:fasciclin domain-containing protein [Calothrix sp. MO_167.B42]